MRKLVIFALVLLCAPAGLFGQALHPDSLFPRLVGHWVLRGTMARQQTVHDVTFEWLLGREYVQMHEVSRKPALNGTTYEAVVLFGRDPQTGVYTCMWLDNTAAAAFDDPRGIGRGSVAGDSVPFLSTTPRPTASTRPSCMIARRTRGSGTWTTTVPECADRLHESP